MTIEELRELCGAEPFVPFDLRTVDGRIFPVKAREFVVSVRKGRTVHLHQPNGSWDSIDLLLVVGAHFNAPESE